MQQHVHCTIDITYVKYVEHIEVQQNVERQLPMQWESLESHI